MIEIITAAGFALAWLAFRYDRHRRWLDAVDAAHGALKAVRHGMVVGLDQAEPVGWGQIYFSTVYTEQVAHARARRTYELVSSRMLDYVLVVPTEPLARLATATPSRGLLEVETVTVANVALWRVHAFNRLVRNMGDFLTANAAEITSADTEDERRHVLANAASSLSLFVHQDGIGQAAAEHPDGSMGWYRALIGAVNGNMKRLEEQQRSARWRWLKEWPYVLGDLFAFCGLVAVIVTVAWPDAPRHSEQAPPSRTPVHARSK